MEGLYLMFVWCVKTEPRLWISVQIKLTNTVPILEHIHTYTHMSQEISWIMTTQKTNQKKKESYLQRRTMTTYMKLEESRRKRKKRKGYKGRGRWRCWTHGVHSPLNRSVEDGSTDPSCLGPPVLPAWSTHTHKTHNKPGFHQANILVCCPHTALNPLITEKL